MGISVALILSYCGDAVWRWNRMVRWRWYCGTVAMRCGDGIGWYGGDGIGW